MKARIAAIVLASLLVIPVVHDASANATMTPQQLGLDASAYPGGAVITRSSVDKTAEAVSAEGILGTKDRHGTLYYKLHFRGSIFQRALLPRFNGSARTVWLMATIFPTSDAANQAYGADSTFDTNCGASPSPDVSIPTQTCAYVNADGQEAGAYVVGVEHNVEFIILGFVELASITARDRATHDTLYVAQQEALHVSHVLRQSGAHAAQPSKSNLRPTVTPTPRSTNTPLPSVTVTPKPNATAMTPPQSNPTPHGHWQQVKQWIVPSGFNSITPSSGEDATLGQVYAVRIVPAHAGDEINGRIMSEYSTGDGVRGEKDIDYDSHHTVFIRVPNPPSHTAYWWINSWLFNGPPGSVLTLMVWHNDA